MASFKDIYEAHTWRANIFAAGVWRGVGAATPDHNVIHLEYSTAGRLHWVTTDVAMHYQSAGRLHYEDDR